MLEERGGGWELSGGAAAGTLPDDLRTLFISRLDRLPERLKSAVEAAAVLGREFEVETLARMVGGSGPLGPRLREAEAESVWAALDEARYLFRHALLRDAAYDMQLVASRRALHVRAAEAIEARHAADPAPRYAEIAHHYEAAHLQGAGGAKEPARRF